MQAHFEFICQPAFLYSEFSAELMQEPQCVYGWEMAQASGLCSRCEWSFLRTIYWMRSLSMRDTTSMMKAMS